MNNTIAVLQGQTIWDIALQAYGDVAGLFLLLADNPVLDLNTTLKVGQLLQIKAAPVNQSVVDYYASNNLKPVSISEQSISDGDFNNDFNNDFN